MEPNLITQSKLMGILEELKKLELMFHHPKLNDSYLNFNQLIDAEFWEVGASGKKYNREYVLNIVTERFHNSNDAQNNSWESKDFHCLEIAPDNYLLTYTLIQEKEKRTTRRASLWRREKEKWKIIYHQGTIVQE